MFLSMPAAEVPIEVNQLELVSNVLTVVLKKTFTKQKAGGTNPS